MATVAPDPVWLIWKLFHDKLYPCVIYGELPESHDARRGWHIEPIRLPDDECNLTLAEIIQRHPAPMKKG